MFLINPYILQASGNPLWNDLLAYYTADNTPNDALGNYNGTLVNGASYGTGIINQGFSFDGVNDYVDLGNNFDFDGSTPFSISLWVYFDTPSQPGIFSKYTATQGYIIRRLSSGTIRFGLYALNVSGGYLSVVTASTIGQGSWNHITVTYNGNKLPSGVNIYINAISQTLTTEINSLTGSTSTTANANIGAIQSATFLDGSIDELGIWNRELTSTEVTELYNSGAGLQYGATALDADAQAFITTASITDPTQQSAINQLVLDLKSASIWSKIYQFMPFCFNDATKNQYDLTLNQNVVFSGGITHASGYIQGNGTNGYVDTQINPTTKPLDSIGHSYFVNTNSMEDWYSGAYDGTRYFVTQTRNTANEARIIINNNGTIKNVSNTSSLGYYTFNRNSSTNETIYKDGSIILSVVDNSTAQPNLNLWFLKTNNIGTYSSRQYNCYVLHQGLDSTESAALHTAVSTFKTTLGI